LTDLTKELEEAFTSFKDAVLAALSGAGKVVGDFSKLLFDAIQRGLGWLTGVIWGWVDGSLRWLTDSFKWLREQVSESAKWTVDAVTTMFDGASAGIGDALRGIAETFRDSLQAGADFFIARFAELTGGVLRPGSPAVYYRTPVSRWWEGWPASIISDGLAGAFKRDDTSGETFTEKAKHAFGISSPEWVEDLNLASGNYFSLIKTEYVDKLIAPPVGSSPVTPEEAIRFGTGLVTTAIGLAAAIWTAHIIAEAGSLGQMDGVNELYHNIMSATGLAAISAAFLRIPLEAGVLIPARQFYMNVFKPEIPGSGDLVRMVVREAFDPKMMIKAPPEFTGAMALQGFSELWCDRYWTAHFEPIALRQAYENLWRGYWEKSDFMYALHIADIHPMWREDIYNVAFRPPSVREMGYGFDVGVYTVDDIIKYRRWEGLSPEDAEKAGISMVAYRTEAEREALRREALEDYVAGLDDEEELRANLAACGGRPEIIELWVERAKYRTKRDLILDLKKTSVDQCVKGWITERQLDQDLIELDFTAERRAVIMEEARTRRLKYKREEETERKKLMTLAKIEKARELGLISDPEYITRVMETGITEEDAELMLAIELTPKPVTAEEMERRRKTVLSKRARAVRRYEMALTRITNQIELTASQLEDAKITMEESLDIIDTQIAVIDADLPTATPERSAVLTARRLVLVQRREAQVARYKTRVHTLTEQHKNLLELRDLTTHQRDEELAEYDAELKLLEVAG